MELPMGIELIEKNKTDDSKYCHQLVKSLYGLKQMLVSAAPKLAHLKLLIGVIGYLIKHPNCYIEFKKSNYRSVIEIYSNANFSTSGKSTSGILKFFDYDVKPIVYIDNLPVIQSIEKDGARTSKARHFQVKFEWLKKSLSSIDLQNKSTSEQLAYFLTKLIKVESLRKLLIH
uniref:PORR domain-containing protein n=1 Tax=Strongyloides venezuelensis TaxID=75913 RepID=A0A0K0FJL9_STRVS